MPLMEEKMSILIVDDSPEQIRFISEMLKSENCKIYAATSCEDAFQIVEKKHVDLLILDIVMPNMDGFTFCRKIKENKDTADIPVIFATAYNDAENIGKSFAAGGSDYVVKPFIREELLERVKVRIQLSQQQKALKKAYEELDTFCYTVSHDIRSPLYVIRQLSELLQTELSAGNAEEASKIGTMLAEKANQAASMTEGLHKFSRVFYEELVYSEVDFNTMVPAVFEELYMLEPDRNIVFEAEKLPVVQGDVVLLQLVVQNILSNALKFTRIRETAKIAVKGEISGELAVLVIEDNGIGFDDTYAKDLFQVFRKLHSDGEYEGDGIGLASVRRIVLRHGGDVEISSVPLEGTKVKIVLPVQKK